jgi:hypothetical protein
MKQYGQIPDEILSRNVTIAVTPCAATNVCKDVTCTAAILIDQLARHGVGEKDGSGFLQGSCSLGKRSLETMREMHVLAIDCDNGIDRDALCERIQGAGLAACVWSTHSHGTTRSIVKARALKEWDGEGCTDAIGWLTDRKRYESSVLEGATVMRDDKRFIVTHKPMDKSRALFFLSEAWRDLESWSGRYRGLLRMLDVPGDLSCTDASRMFFFPRHARGATDYATTLLGGAALDLSSIEPVDAPVPGHGIRVDHNNPFRIAALGLGISGSDGKPYIKSPTDQYLIDHRKRLLFAKLYNDWQDGAEPRGDGNYGGVCPWSELHSDPDDDGDMGFWCTDADPSKNEAFRCYCHHDGCSGRRKDAFWFASKFCDNNSIEINELREYTI